MPMDEPTKAVCPRCGDVLAYVTALPHPKAANMLRTTFLCQPCNRTWTYSLSPAMADAYAMTAPKMIPGNNALAPPSLQTPSTSP
jgi:transposase-like protein